MSVPNAPAGRPVPAINPTMNGATFSGTPPAPDGRSFLGALPTGNGTTTFRVANSPLLRLPPTTSRVINWTPNAGGRTRGTATTPASSANAGILTAAGAVVVGSQGPPYVSGNVVVGVDQVGTSVVLRPVR